VRRELAGKLASTIEGDTLSGEAWCDFATDGICGAEVAFSAGLCASFLSGEAETEVVCTAFCVVGAGEAELLAGCDGFGLAGAIFAGLAGAALAILLARKCRADLLEGQTEFLEAFVCAEGGAVGVLGAAVLAATGLEASVSRIKSMAESGLAVFVGGAGLACFFEGCDLHGLACFVAALVAVSAFAVLCAGFAAIAIFVEDVPEEGGIGIGAHGGP
jgi:hypothetical protein